MRWWYLGQYYLLFGIQSVKTSFCYILIFFSLTKILSLSFFVGSFTVKTMRRLNNYCKSQRNCWASVQHINEHRWKAQYLFITNS